MLGWLFYDPPGQSPYLTNRLLRITVGLFAIGLAISLTKQVQYNRDVRQLILDTCR